MHETALPRLIFALLAACPVLLRADVRLPAVLSDGMVIQQGASVRMWGRAEPGEMVTVTLAGASRVTNAVGDGRWQLFF
ncbi:acetyl esterase, partial [bacterium]|nr:acetyl esterase [bacterium]